MMRRYSAEHLPELRCRHCNRLIMKGVVIQGEAKCPRCHKLTIFNIQIKTKSGQTANARQEEI